MSAKTFSEHPGFVDERMPLRPQLEGVELVGEECHRARRVGVVNMTAGDCGVADRRRTAQPRHQILDAHRSDERSHALGISFRRREIVGGRCEPRRPVVDFKQCGAGQQLQVVTVPRDREVELLDRRVGGDRDE